MKKFFLSMLTLVATAFGAAAADTYVPLTDLSELNNANGLECILVAKKGNDTYVLGTSQKSNNRQAVKLSDSSIANGGITPGATTQIVTVKPLKVSDTETVYYFYAPLKNNSGDSNNRYLTGGYTAGNYLRSSKDLPTAKGQSTATITKAAGANAAEGQVEIVFNGTESTSANYMQFNSSSSIFACYKTASQTPVMIYKKFDAATQTKTLAPTFEGFGATGTYWAATNVKLNLEEGADAWYTTDGTEPTEASTAYTTAGIDVPAATEDGQTFVIKAIAKKGSLELSDVATLTLTAEKQYRLVKYNTVVPGAKYRWVVKDGETYKASTNCGTSHYMNVATVNVTDDAFESALADNYVVFEDRGEGKYALKQADGQYLYMTDQYYSFSKSETFDATSDYYLWTVAEEADGTVKISNVGRSAKEATDVYIQFGTANNNFNVYKSSSSLIPALYINEEDKALVPPTYPEKLYVLGQVNGNDFEPSTGVEMTNAGNGTYTLTGANFEIGAYFAFTSVLDGVWNNVNAARYAGEADNQAVAADATGIKLVKGMDRSLKMVESGVYTLTVDLATMTLSVVRTGKLPVAAPETLYVLGDLKDAHWVQSRGTALTKDGNKFTGEIELEAAGTEAYGWWALVEKLGTDWNAVNEGMRFGPTEMTEVTAPATFDFYVYKGANAESCPSWKTLPGKYKLVVDFDAQTVTMTAANALPDPKLKFNEEQPVNMKAMTEYRTIAPAVAEAEGFDGTINYSIEDMEGNTLTEGYSLMVAESGENLRFMAAGKYLLVASTEATDKWAAGRATLEINVTKSSVRLTFNANSYEGVVGDPVKNLEAVTVDPITYDGTVIYTLSGAGLTSDDYTLTMNGSEPVLTVNKAGTWTLTAMAPATKAFLGDRIVSTVKISEKSAAPADPEVFVGIHKMDTESVWRSQNRIEAEMTCETEGAKIYWSYKPANENEGSAFVEYTEPVEIAVDGTLTVYAELNGIKSEAKSYGFIIESSVAMTVADAEGLEMYTLDGIRVRHPEAGRVYVVIADGRAYRVILK